MLTVAAVVLGASLSVALAVASCAAPRACAGGIFTDSARQGALDPGVRRTVRRWRRVEIDFGRVFPGGERPSAARSAHRLTLNLFPDVCLIAVRERASDVGPGKVEWTGRVQGSTDGSVILIIDDTLMVGTIRIDREVYEIRYLGESVHAVSDIDQSAFPRD